MANRLNGRVALITGAASGFGEGIARRFAASASALRFAAMLSWRPSVSSAAPRSRVRDGASPSSP